MGNRITYVGLDVHKETIVVAVAEGGIRGEIREYGRIANTPTALDRVMRKLGRDGTAPAGEVAELVQGIRPMDGRDGLIAPLSPITVAEDEPLRWCGSTRSCPRTPSSSHSSSP